MTISIVSGLGTRAVSPDGGAVVIAVNRGTGEITYFGNISREAMNDECASTNVTELSQYVQRQGDVFSVRDGKVISVDVREVVGDVYKKEGASPFAVEDGVLVEGQIHIRYGHDGALRRNLGPTPYGSLGQHYLLVDTLSQLCRERGPVQIEGAFVGDKPEPLYLYQRLTLELPVVDHDRIPNVGRPFYRSSSVAGAGHVRIPLVFYDGVGGGLSKVDKLYAETGYALFTEYHHRKVVDATPNCRIRITDGYFNPSSHAVTQIRMMGMKDPAGGYMLAQDAVRVNTAEGLWTLFDMGPDRSIGGTNIYLKGEIDSNGRELVVGVYKEPLVLPSLVFDAPMFVIADIASDVTTAVVTGENERLENLSVVDAVARYIPLGLGGALGREAVKKYLPATSVVGFRASAKRLLLGRGVPLLSALAMAELAEATKSGKVDPKKMGLAMANIAVSTAAVNGGVKVLKGFKWAADAARILKLVKIPADTAGTAAGAVSGGSATLLGKLALLTAEFTLFKIIPEAAGAVIRWSEKKDIEEKVENAIDDAARLAKKLKSGKSVTEEEWLVAESTLYGLKSALENAEAEWASAIEEAKRREIDALLPDHKVNALCFNSLPCIDHVRDPQKVKEITAFFDEQKKAFSSDNAKVYAEFAEKIGSSISQMNETLMDMIPPKELENLLACLE